jgi:hypothetical protein
MAETNYPGNSDREQQQNLPTAPQPGHGRPSEKKVTSVVHGGVRQKEPGIWNKVSEFFGMDELKTFKDYVSFVADITNRVYSAMDTLMGNRRGPTTPGARIQYGSYYQSQNPPQNSGNARQRAEARYSYNDLVFDTRGDAEVVLANMRGLLTEYRAVSIADMFDLAELTSPNGYTDNKYGWTDLSTARVIRVNGGYMIDLPRAGQL